MTDGPGPPPSPNENSLIRACVSKGLIIICKSKQTRAKQLYKSNDFLASFTNDSLYCEKKSENQFSITTQ